MHSCFAPLLACIHTHMRLFASNMFSNDFILSLSFSIDCELKYSVKQQRRRPKWCRKRLPAIEISSLIVWTTYIEQLNSFRLPFSCLLFSQYISTRLPVFLFTSLLNDPIYWTKHSHSNNSYNIKFLLF